MNSSKDELIKKQLLKKIQKLAELEKNQKVSENNDDTDKLMISRTIFAFIGGFVILRTFSKTKFTPFTLNVIPERIEVSIKKRIPFEMENGQIYNLYELLKNTVGLRLSIGSKLDIGSTGGGFILNDKTRIGGFQIMIFKNDQIEEISETLEDINFAIYSNNELERLKTENIELSKHIKEISEINEPIIITEGKTDWKYIISALRFYHSKNEYLNIKEEWFLKFGSLNDIKKSHCNTSFELENSVSKLNSILESFIDSRNIEKKQIKWPRIGIFDSDDKKVRNIYDVENKVFSLIIEPDNISTELLFSENEIKTEIEERRLYLGTEFDFKTGQLLADRNIIIGNDNNTRNKSGKNVIIDSNVYNSEGENIALSKEDFSTKIYNNEIKISEKSWENFRHIFIKISEFIK